MADSVLGLVLARGSSKGLPGKNWIEIGGKPLLAWTIDAGLESALIDDLVVSTDSTRIADLAKDLGAEVPFLRPPEYATDEASSVDAVLHAISELELINRRYDYVVLLEPTSPLRESQDIDQALSRLFESQAQAIVSVARVQAAHPAFLYYKDEKDFLQPLMPVWSGHVRRQDTEALFFLEGSIYASTVRALRRYRSFYHRETIGFELPKWKAPEIDDRLDVIVVEAIMEQRASL